MPVSMRRVDDVLRRPQWRKKKKKKKLRCQIGSEIV